MQPLDAATLAQSNSGSTSTAAPREEGLGMFSGAVRHRNVSEGRSAFSGTGRTLGGSTVNQVEKQNAGKDESPTVSSNVFFCTRGQRNTHLKNRVRLKLVLEFQIN